jgi:NitT/TauT family transport system ATP-binding protein
MTEEPVLRVRGLCKEYASARGAVNALANVSFDVHSGERVCVVGPSGCGKSTLLGMLAGLDVPSRGQLLLDERPIHGAGSDRGMVFQRDCLFPWLTIEQNVGFAIDLAHHRAKRDAFVHARARALLAEVGLAKFASAYPRQLSGGMRQRAAIARALLHQPRILLMDEPFGALDAQTREQMQELLLRLCERERTTLVFVTHDVEEAVFLADRVLVMSAHPGAIAAELRVPMPRPRAPMLKLEPEFAAVRRTVLNELEAVRRESAA